MKVCILTTSFPAYKGHFQSPFIFKLAESLAERLDVDVVCPYYKESRKKELKYKQKLKEFKSKLSDDYINYSVKFLSQAKKKLSITSGLKSKAL